MAAHPRSVVAVVSSVWSIVLLAPAELKPSASLVSHRVALSAAQVCSPRTGVLLGRHQLIVVPVDVAQDTYSRLLTSPNEFLQVLFQYERA